MKLTQKVRFWGFLMIVLLYSPGIFSQDKDEEVTPQKGVTQFTSKNYTFQEVQRVLKKDFRKIHISENTWKQMINTKNNALIPIFIGRKFEPTVIDAIRIVPRELYAYNYETHIYQPNLVYKPYQIIDIGWGSTISASNAMALMTHLAKPQKDYVALEIGTGSGYQAALLARLVNKVYSIEIREELAKKVIDAMKLIGDNNVKYKIADGYYGWKEKAPFDIIIVTCQANHIPPPLIAQLKPGGRMVIPVGPAWKKQTMYLVQKTESGKIKTRAVCPTVFIPMLTYYSKTKQIARTKKEEVK